MGFPRRLNPIFATTLFLEEDRSWLKFIQELFPSQNNLCYHYDDEASSITTSIFLWVQKTTMAVGTSLSYEDYFFDPRGLNTKSFEHTDCANIFSILISISIPVLPCETAHRYSFHCQQLSSLASMCTQLDSHLLV